MSKNQTIQTDINLETQEETAASVSADFPYRTDNCVFSKEIGFYFPWHWHNDVEIFYIKKGVLEYLLAGEIYEFCTGDVGFVNANVLHSTRSKDKGDCVQQEHIFLPGFINGMPGSAIDRNYVQPLLKNPNARLLKISAENPAAQEFRALMDKAFEAFCERKVGFEVEIREAMMKVWLLFLKNAPKNMDAQNPNDRDDSRIKAMLSFIEGNYEKSLTLEQIAGSAFVSGREGNRCFNRQLGMSVFEYLLDYRVRRAKELLRDTDLPVTQVALSSGFSTSSYFGKVFMQKTGVSPSEYRKSLLPK